MLTKDKIFLRACFLVLFFSATLAVAQEKSKTGAVEQREDVIRVDTRVVFVDVSVRDAKINQPIRDLALKNFQLYDDGKPRSLTYFSREGDTRRPLSLLIFVDLWSLYGRKYIKQPTAMARLANALRQLAPEDEVAVMATWIEERDEPDVAVPKVKTISDFTSDRRQTITALESVPKLVGEQEKLLDDIVRRAGISKSEIDLVWSLADIAETVMPQASLRPNRQFVVAGLIDDLFTLKRGERDQVAKLAARMGITFYGLVYKKSVAGKLFLGAINQMVMRPSGKSLHAADYLAEQTGGQVSSIGNSDDLAIGLESIIGDLASRYSLGFLLDENERDDGLMHQLQVSVKSLDGQGKKRNLKIRARQSYYKPEAIK